MGAAPRVKKSFSAVARDGSCIEVTRAEAQASREADQFYAQWLWPSFAPHKNKISLKPHFQLHPYCEIYILYFQGPGEAQKVRFPRYAPGRKLEEGRGWGREGKFNPVLWFWERFCPGHVDLLCSLGQVTLPL
jgi:hypothetical protein